MQPVATLHSSLVAVTEMAEIKHIVCLVLAKQKKYIYNRSLPWLQLI